MSKPVHCPKCDAVCTRDEVDIGVGIQYGPYTCTECGWNEDHNDVFLIGELTDE
jgi:hypothetical protein